MNSRSFSSMASRAYGAGWGAPGGAYPGGDGDKRKDPRKKKSLDDDENASDDGDDIDQQDPSVVIDRILKASKDRDWCKVMDLPPPTMDAADRVKVDSTASTISKRYRSLSRVVHPDKCTHAQCVQAFRVLQEAKRNLLDAGSRAEYCKQYTGIARTARDIKYQKSGYNKQHQEKIKIIQEEGREFAKQILNQQQRATSQNKSSSNQKKRYVRKTGRDEDEEADMAPRSPPPVKPKDPEDHRDEDEDSEGSPVVIIQKSKLKRRKIV